jgi:hypothetical protein
MTSQTTGIYMFINKKIIVCFAMLLLISESIFANQNLETVRIKNATYCHLLSGNAYRLGQASYLGSFTAEGTEFSLIAPGETKDVPLIKENGQQYIILDFGSAADQFSFEYTNEYKYIVSYDDNNRCTRYGYPPCIKISKKNPCL